MPSWMGRVSLHTGQMHPGGSKLRRHILNEKLNLGPDSMLTLGPSSCCGCGVSSLTLHTFVGIWQQPEAAGSRRGEVP